MNTMTVIDAYTYLIKSEKTSMYFSNKDAAERMKDYVEEIVKPDIELEITGPFKEKDFNFNQTFWILKPI